ncbi:TetR/AcrR family transcriptional regulator [Paenarthrobacter sp. NPDC090520]|uniref:TetR/AcrR family transcriptional regulator n=1 Tax=Paenarthrobacter sp. NPDC090520 TaxID=3364382 RepID=UPI003825E419
MTDQPYHHGKLREALLERAMETLETSGVEGLSLRQLARDLNVSHAAPAKHFRDKQALIDALAMAGFGIMNGHILEASQSGRGLQGRFVSVAKAYVDFALTRPALLSVMYSTKHQSDSTDELRSIGEQGMLVALALIQEGQDSGALAEGDPGTLAMVCFSGLHGTAMLAAGKHLEGTSTEAIVKAVTDTLWAGMAAGVPAAQAAGQTVG